MSDAPSKPVRRDPRAARRAAPPRSTGAVAATAGAPVEWDDSARTRVLVALEALNGRLSVLDRVLLGAGRLLAASNERVVAVAFAELADDAFAAGADSVVSFPALSGFQPDSQAAALAAVRNRVGAAHVLFGEAADSADLGRRFALASGEGVATDVVAIEANEVVRNAGNLPTEHVGALQPVMLLTATACAPYGGPRRQAMLPPVVDVQPVGGELKALRIEHAEPESVSLSEARFITSAGAGVRDWKLFQELCSALHATRGGSRVVCDAGHLPRDRQVGASGTLVTADCYIALGISGATQHLAGIENCKFVIAVNQDPHAPIFERADLGVVSDVQQFMDALLRIKQARRP